MVSVIDLSPSAPNSLSDCSVKMVLDLLNTTPPTRPRPPQLARNFVSRRGWRDISGARLPQAFPILTALSWGTRSGLQGRMLKHWVLSTQPFARPSGSSPGPSSCSAQLWAVYCGHPPPPPFPTTGQFFSRVPGTPASHLASPVPYFCTAWQPADPTGNSFL